MHTQQSKFTFDPVVWSVSFPGRSACFSERDCRQVFHHSDIHELAPIKSAPYSGKFRAICSQESVLSSSAFHQNSVRLQERKMAMFAKQLARQGTQLTKVSGLW